MKQLIQYFRSGELEMIDVPMPQISKNTLVIETHKSMISVGTEKMLLEFGKASLLNKAKQQPDKVKQVLTKIKTEGLLSTFEAVWTKLNEPIPLGYSNVGIIAEANKDSSEFSLGNRVVSNGPHAEFVKVSENLTVKVPENISDEQATFTILGAIALQGIRLFKPEIGEKVVVVGLGLLGQLTLQMLQANGCDAIGIDLDQNKVIQAQQLGFMATLNTDPEASINSVMQLTKDVGADGVIITASSGSDDLLSQTAVMTRKRGRIILVGVIPISVPRNLFYEKELQFQVSCSYGPGRYDRLYEEKAFDYPLPFVRWTAKRNMEAFLKLLEDGKIAVNHLITHRFPFGKVQDAYKIIESEKPLGIILEYDKEKKGDKIILPESQVGNKVKLQSGVRIGFIGVGSFAKMILLPAILRTKSKIEMISSSDGISAAIAAKKIGNPIIVSDANEIYKNKSVNTVFIATRPVAHKAQVIKGMENKKHIFVEKPLAISLDEIKEIYQIHLKNTDINLMVGFNRRFAPTTRKLSDKIKNRINPISISIMVNAGPLPSDHWAHDPEINGGRIIAECCHFIDLARYLVGSKIESVCAISTHGYAGTDEDKVISILSFEDGSHVSIHYLANGNKSFPKERVEVFSSEKVYVIDNFRVLKSFGDATTLKKLKLDKGHNQEILEFIKAIENGDANPIPMNEIYEVHLATFAIYRSIREQRIIKMKEMWEDLLS